MPLAVFLRVRRGPTILGAVLALMVILPEATSGKRGGDSSGVGTVRREAGAAKTAIGQCGAQQGQAARECVANALAGFSAGLQRAAIAEPSMDLAASGPVSQAASGVRAAGNKTAAISVINRAASVIASLAAASQANTRRAYSITGNVLSRALSVINRRG